MYDLQIQPPPITRADFDKVLARQKPTVSKADLEVHERFMEEFGEESWLLEFEHDWLTICTGKTTSTIR